MINANKLIPNISEYVKRINSEVSKKLEIYQNMLKDKVLGTVTELKKSHPNQYDH